MLCLQNVYESFLNWKSGFHPSSVSLIYRSPSRFQRKSFKCHALVKYDNKKTFMTNLPVYSFNTCFIRYSLFKKQCQIFTSCSLVWGLLLTFSLQRSPKIFFHLIIENDRVTLEHLYENDRQLVSHYYIIFWCYFHFYLLVSHSFFRAKLKMS